MSQEDQVFQSGDLPFLVALKSVSKVSNLTTIHNPDCLICHRKLDLSETIVVHNLPCNVAYHLSCVQTRLTEQASTGNNPSCPSCREDLTPSLTPNQDVIKQELDDQYFWLSSDIECLVEELVAAIDIDITRYHSPYTNNIPIPTTTPSITIQEQARKTSTQLRHEMKTNLTNLLLTELKQIYNNHITKIYPELITTPRSTQTTQTTTTTTYPLWIQCYLSDLSDELFTQIANLIGSKSQETTRTMLALTNAHHNIITNHVTNDDEMLIIFHSTLRNQRDILDTLTTDLTENCRATIKLHSHPTARMWRAWRNHFRDVYRHPPRREIRYWDNGVVKMVRRPWPRIGGVVPVVRRP